VLWWRVERREDSEERDRLLVFGLWLGTYSSRLVAAVSGPLLFPPLPNYLERRESFYFFTMRKHDYGEKW